MTANGIKRNFSLLGGEPFANYNLETTKKVLSFIKENHPYTKTYCWTGYTLDMIKKNKDILELIDVLIEGPYIQEQRDITLPLRGSKNQRILFKGVHY